MSVKDMLCLLKWCVMMASFFLASLVLTLIPVKTTWTAIGILIGCLIILAVSLQRKQMFDALSGIFLLAFIFGSVGIVSSVLSLASEEGVPLLDIWAFSKAWMLERQYHVGIYISYLATYFAMLAIKKFR